MITLNDVSAKTVISLNGYFSSSIELAAKKAKVKSVQDVIKLIDKHPEYDWTETIKIIKNVEKLMNNANSRGNQPEQYFTKDYSMPLLKKQDTLNRGDILLLESPTHFHTKYNGLKSKTIAEIKDDLAHTVPDGRGYISGNNCSYRKIGSTDLPKITNAIEMYQDQIERQANLAYDVTDDLFIMDSEEKTEIVEQTYKDIIEYLVDNTQAQLVWGQLSDTQKKIYISSTIYKSQQDKETKENIVSYISNYTTLPELEQVAKYNLKVLKRFIVK